MDTRINIIKEIVEDMIRFTPFRLVDIEHKQFKSKHTFSVYLDSMNGLTVSDCQLFTRRINEAMEISGSFEDSYILEVSSPGIDRPIRHDWQFKKNIGRKIEVVHIDETGQEKLITARLVDFQEDKVFLRLVTRQKKSTDTNIVIPINKIKTAKIQVEWN